MAKGFVTDEEGFSLSLTLGRPDLRAAGEAEKFKKDGTGIMNLFLLQELKKSDNGLFQREKESNTAGSKKPGNSDLTQDLLKCLGGRDDVVRAPESDQKGGERPVEKGEKERSFFCKYCRKEFFTAQALGGHQNAHKLERAREKEEKREKSDAPRSTNPNCDRYKTGLGIQRGSMIQKQDWSRAGRVHGGHGRHPGILYGSVRMRNGFFDAGRIQIAYDERTGGCWWIPGCTAQCSLSLLKNEKL